MHRRVAAATIVVIGLCAAGASAASAAPIALGGSPLNVFVDSRGQLQAFKAGSTTGIYYPSDSQTGDAGFFLAELDGTPTVNGFDGAAGPDAPPVVPYTFVNASPVTGTGTAADPLKQMTTYVTADTDISITQTTTYVNGSQEYRVRWDVTNTLGATTPVHFKAIAAADFFFDGSDRGTGIYTQGPPQFIGGTNADTGFSGGFVEVPSTSPWSRYQALAFGGGAGQLWNKVETSATTTPTLDNTVVGEQVDNAGAVEWDQYATGAGLAGGATASFELVARNAIPSALQINPPNAGAPKGVPINFTATALDTAGVPYAGRTLRYTITGPNAASGSATIGADGNATITDPGTNAGADTVVAYVDFNNNGSRQDAEPQASALATFVDSIPPTCTVKSSGDRPGGSGGAGKPLVITVNCNEASTVTVQTTLQPRASRSRAATVDKKKPKKKKKAKKVTIKLRTTTLTVAPGRAVPVSLKLSSAVRKKYAGKTLTATITVTARDASGNVKKTKTTRTVKLAKLKKSKAHKKR
jgi:hypothetical protein